MKGVTYTDSEYVLTQGTPLGAFQSEHHDLVRECIELLGEENRTVLNMYYYERLTYQAIADELGLRGRAYAFYRVRRALRALQVLLLETGVFD